MPTQAETDIEIHHLTRQVDHTHNPRKHTYRNPVNDHLCLLHTIKQKFPEIDFGLYRDDSLGAIKRTPKTHQREQGQTVTKQFDDSLGLKRS